MKVKVTKGDFSEFGTKIIDKNAAFTFSVQTKEAPSILLFDKKTKELIVEIKLHSEFRLGNVYSVVLSGPDFSRYCYLLKRDGKVGPDVFAPVIIGREKWNDVSRFDEGYKTYCGFSVSSSDYEWNFVPPRIAPEDTIIYKLHMRGFTMKNSLPHSKKGNYLGIIEKLPYFKSLGVNTLEFLPLYEFEEIRFRTHLETGENHTTIKVNEKPYGVNYWGYGPGEYFAPKASYFGGSKCDLHMKEMVDRIHGEGMEIIMEFSFSPELPTDILTESLVYWLKEYHIDGFHLIGYGIPIERIANNPFLSGTKIFYDSFPEKLLSNTENDKHLFITNDDFEYPLRRLQNHMDGNVSEFADFMKRQGGSFGFVNYAANNTGFTLYDVYSYGEKHNEANGEENTDGTNYNCSNNHGFEGRTKNHVVNRLREICVRGALLSVFMSQGIPMIFEGDEILNTQDGNNNPYCQDNETGWVTFSKRQAALSMQDYVKKLIMFRKTHTVLSSPAPYFFQDYKHVGLPDVSYHGREPWIMGIGAEKKALGILFAGAYGRKDDEEDVMLLFNFYFGEETFALPKLTNKRWYFINNTSSFDWNDEGEVLRDQTSCIVPGGTISVIVGRKIEETPDNTARSSKVKKALARKTVEKTGNS